MKDILTVRGPGPYMTSMVSAGPHCIPPGVLQDHAHRQIKSCSSGRGTQQGLCQLSAGDGQLAPKGMHIFAPPWEKAATPHPLSLWWGGH